MVSGLLLSAFVVVVGLRMRARQALIAGPAVIALGRNVRLPALTALYASAVNVAGIAVNPVANS